MPQIGPLEILVIGVVALVFIGPSKLPEVARNFGKALAEFKSHADGYKNEFKSGLQLDAATDASASHATPTASEITGAASQTEETSRTDTDEAQLTN